MDILQLIKHRRTTKPEDFNGKIIPKNLINTILESANWAPTHGLTEPWRFILFPEKEGVKKFGKLHAEIYKKETLPNVFLQKKYDTLLHKPDLASHVIVVIMKRGDNQNIPVIEEIAATACAVQNLLLSATAHNIATYWGTGGMCYHPSLKTHFNLDEEDQIMGFIYLGYTDLEIKDGLRNSPIEDKITWC